METKMKNLRAELDELGYYNQFTAESFSLVDRLLGDLKTTTESLQKYMTIAQNAIDERDSLQVGAEPYKCDNARLIKECNKLHFELIKSNEQYQNAEFGLKKRIEELKLENSEHQSEKAKLRSKIRDLESDILKPKSKPKTTRSAGALTVNTSPKKSRTFEISSTMALADQKLANLSKDIKKLKCQNIQLLESNEILQNQLLNREKEIKRLNVLFEGGRPLKAIKRDCCCNKENHDDYNSLKHEKINLEAQLKDALAKQHEAMKRALHLAERNKLLEKEMKDIDYLAMAVETDCNNTVKCNAEKVNRLQDRMHGTVLQIQTLEREVVKLKQEKLELAADLDAIVLERKHLQSVLENTLDEKKRLADRINNFTIIEQDLNKEIDRLSRLSAEQKRKIAELECSLVSEKVQDRNALTKPQVIRRTSNFSQTEKLRTDNNSTNTEVCNDSQKTNGVEMRSNSSPDKNGGEKRTAKKSNRKASNSSNGNTKSKNKRKTSDGSNQFGAKEKSGNYCDCNCEMSKHLKELLDKELDLKQEQTNRCIESLRTEKEYYMKEYHKLLEEQKQAPLSTRRTSSSTMEKTDLVQKLFDLEQNLASLRHENKILSQEKSKLGARLESARDRPETEINAQCYKTTCKRTERECSILRADVERMEEECDSLKLKLQKLADSQVYDTDRYKKALIEAEDQIKRLETERRRTSQNQGMVAELEEQSDGLKAQLRTVQSELNHQKMLYNQIKALHESTDRSLADTQNKLASSENELARVLDDLKKRDMDTGVASKEVGLLRNDVQILKAQLAQIDKEKDELLIALDEKTERLAMMELELKTKDKTIASFESMANELKKKLSNTIDETSSQQLLYRTSQTDLTSLRQELEAMRRIKDGALDENRRLQDDLASLTCDNRDCRKELDICRRQIDDLKTQLQQYVAEVKRTEDLISNKEIERNELLDQFRSLSQEANVLETNNHTLETVASQSKVQLSVALDHAADLERRLDNKESIIRSYEKQIGELTSQIASLEMQLRQFMQQYEKNEGELDKLRDLCHKLDTENAGFKRQLRDRDDQRAMSDRNVEQLRSERELMQTNLSKDKRNVESIEKNLDDAKQQSSELQLLNQDLQEEVQRLKVQLQEIKDRLSLCPCNLKSGAKVHETMADNEKATWTSSSYFPSAGSKLVKERCVCWGLNKYHEDCIMNFRGENNEGLFILAPSLPGIGCVQEQRLARVVTNYTVVHESPKR